MPLTATVSPGGGSAPASRPPRASRSPPTSPSWNSGRGPSSQLWQSRVRPSGPLCESLRRSVMSRTRSPGAASSSSSSPWPESRILPPRGPRHWSISTRRRRTRLRKLSRSAAVGSLGGGKSASSSSSRKVWRSSRFVRLWTLTPRCSSSGSASAPQSRSKSASCSARGVALRSAPSAESRSTSTCLSRLSRPRKCGSKSACDLV
mmetsp:Transcript_56898/g.161518  ORF Transcript_56898/g.161518 Transcript_56898/m.161518 type:complete len:205 (+) Transcript_56898:2125-2739(+)